MTQPPMQTISASPPRLRGLPLVGNAVGFARDPFGTMAAARELGPVVALRLPFIRAAYLVSSPEAIETVLLKRHAAFKKDLATRLLAHVTGSGLLTSEGAFWRRQRGLAQPALHHKRLVGYAEAMVRLTRARVDRWRRGGELDLGKEMMAFTLSIVAETLFGAQVSTEAETETIGRALDDVMDYYLGVAGSGYPMPLALPTPGVRRFKRAVRAIDDVVYRLIAARRAEGEAATAARGDLLSMLLSARDDEGRTMDERQLRDEVVTLFLAGHETTALALTWTLWLLGHHPGVEARLRAELGEVLGERDATVEDLARLRFTEAVIQESMRLYPPAWVIGREAEEEVEVGGFRVERGAQLIIPTWAVHRDPALFPSPSEFRPARWESGELARSLPRFAYFPFGGGPRICIGNAFAKMEAVLALATILQRARLTLPPQPDPGLLPSVTLRPRRPIRALVSV
jgi:cytochrome P450